MLHLDSSARTPVSYTHLAGQHRVLRLIGGIRTRGMRLRRDVLDQIAAVVTRLAQHRLPQAQRRNGLVTTIVIGAPQGRLAIELLEYRQNHACGIVHRGRIAAPVIGQVQRVVALGTLQEACLLYTSRCV